MPDPRRVPILVTAIGHDELDDWVLSQAALSGHDATTYLGREGVLGLLGAPDMRCHVFGDADELRRGILAEEARRAAAEIAWKQRREIEPTPDTEIGS